MSNNIVDLGSLGKSTTSRERYPEFHYEVTYNADAEGQYATETVTGFLTAMGGLYFIGKGFRPNHQIGQDGEVDWHWTAPIEGIRSIKAIAPAGQELNA